MIILGLHFGHDATASVIKDGEILSWVLRERHSRIKHAISLDVETVDKALVAAGITALDVDCCAITSTQGMELITDDPEKLSVSLDVHTNHNAPMPLYDLLLIQNKINPDLFSTSLIPLLYGEPDPNNFCRLIFAKLFPEHKTRKKEDVNFTPWLDNYAYNPIWNTEPTLDDLAMKNLGDITGNDAMRLGFHYPAVLSLYGENIPAYFVHHHAAHAASGYYLSGFSDAAILTHDGFSDARGYQNGMFYYGNKNRIYPVSPHHLMAGVMYESVGISLGLGIVGTPGKLMGLAPYGSPRFFDRTFVGNWYDLVKHGKTDPASDWISHCHIMARMMGYDMAPLADPNQVKAPINADIAASTQKLFEETMLLAAEALHKILLRHGLQTKNLCLSGGTALNCPANSRIFREGRFSNVSVEPSCDDSGLAVGASLYLYHNVFDNKLIEPQKVAKSIPYVGVNYSKNDIESTLKEYGDRIIFSKSGQYALEAALDLASNKVIGWFEGKSEVGPRALGHRSILADPRHKENWQRVNKIKGREEWRPFAPAVLETESEEWFQGCPTPSPYMLFTATVKSNEIPAITHVLLRSDTRVQSFNQYTNNS
jgi:carbamoyltransferase